MSKRDYERGIYIKGAFGRRDYMYIYEVAPWAYDRIHDYLKVSIKESVALDILDDWTRQLGQVDLARYLGVAPGLTNPIHTQTVVSGSVVDPRSIRALTSADEVTTYPQAGQTWPVSNAGLSMLDVLLSTRATETTLSALNTKIPTDPAKESGQLASIKTNTDKLDVALSTKARLQPWYQTNFASIAYTYSGSSIAPHSFTDRATYTVPANRLFKIGNIFAFQIRATAATAAGLVSTMIYLTRNSTTYNLNRVDFLTNNVGDKEGLAAGEGTVFKAADVVKIATQDVSTGGTIHYRASFFGCEFDT